MSRDTHPREPRDRRRRKITTLRLPNPAGPVAGPKKANPLLPGGWIILVVALVLAIVYFTASQAREIDYSQFTDLIDAGQVKKVVLIGTDRIEGEVRDADAEAAKPLKGSTKFSVNLPHTQEQPTLIHEWEAKDQLYRDRLKAKDPADSTEKISISKRDDPSWVGPFILNLVLIGLVIGILVFVFLPKLRDPMGGGFLNSYTRSPAKRYERGKSRVTFEDVAGMDNAKGELSEIV